MSLHQKKKKKRFIYSWLVPIHLNAKALIAYRNNRARLHLITFHILTTKFAKGFTQPVSQSSCLLLILQKLPGHSSQGADTLGVSTPGIKALLHTYRALNHTVALGNLSSGCMRRETLGESALPQRKKGFFNKTTR